MECSTDGPCIRSDWPAAYEFVAATFVLDSGARDARLDDIVLGYRFRR